MTSFLQNIAEFIEVVRLAGVRIGISEAQDAVMALHLVDLSDKQAVYSALAACLAKSEEEQHIFKEAFQRYFVSADVKKALFQQKIEEIQQQKSEIEQSASTLKFKEIPLSLSDAHKQTYSRLPDEEKENIISYLDKSSEGKNVREDLRPLVEKIVAGKLDKYKQTHQCALPPFDSSLERVQSEAGFISEEINAVLREKNALLYKNIADISEEEIPEMIRLIRILSEKMHRQLSRKKIVTGRKSSLDIKKTLRSNMSTGQVLFKLKYKTPSRKKNPFVMLCDVSASMTRFSSFVLQFVLGMHQSVARLDAYIFSQTVEPLNLMQLKRPEDFEEIVKQSTVWRKGTHIGQALEQLLSKEDSKLHASTILLIVSDAKTIEVEKFLENLKKLKKKVKLILWFNPVPMSEWEKIPGIAEVRGLCSMIECSNLVMLAQACTSIE